MGKQVHSICAPFYAVAASPRKFIYLFSDIMVANSVDKEKCAATFCFRFVLSAFVAADKADDLLLHFIGAVVCKHSSDRAPASQLKIGPRRN